MDSRTMLNEAKKAAERISQTGHLDAAVKTVMFDLIQICESLEAELAETAGQSSETRLLKKRIEQMKLDSRSFDKKLESYKKITAGILEAAKSINAELPKISDPVVASCIRSEVQKIAEAIRDAAKLSEAS